MKSVELLNKINNYLKDFNVNLDTVNNTITIKPKFINQSNYDLVRLVDLYKHILLIILSDYN